MPGKREVSESRLEVFYEGVFVVLVADSNEESSVRMS